jgi:hypothetical protein
MEANSEKLLGTGREQSSWKLTDVMEAVKKLSKELTWSHSRGGGAMPTTGPMALSLLLVKTLKFCQSGT